MNVALRDYFEERPPGDKVFINQYGQATTKPNVRQYFLRHLKRTGIVKEPEDSDASTRYGKNPHELRDLFRTRWQKSGASPEVAEFCMDHVVDPLGYNKAMRDPDYVRREDRIRPSQREGTRTLEADLSLSKVL